MRGLPSRFCILALLCVALQQAAPYWVTLSWPCSSASASWTAIISLQLSEEEKKTNSVLFKHSISSNPTIFFSHWQSMDPSKSQLPSVTLIVGCGVSSLTLLLLIIIYVSVWRYAAAWKKGGKGLFKAESKWEWSMYMRISIEDMHACVYFTMFPGLPQWTLKKRWRKQTDHTYLESSLCLTNLSKQ